MKLDTLATLFLSIFLEALPFLLLGTLLSAVVEVFVSQEKIASLIPKNKVLGIVAASLIGLIFPLCECAIVPVTGRLVKKGLPLPIAITFMLAVPIVNPLVILSTYYAFSTRLEFLFLRLGGGMGIAILAGLVLAIIYKKQDVLLDAPSGSSTPLPSKGIKPIGFEPSQLDSGTAGNQPFFTPVLEGGNARSLPSLTPAEACCAHCSDTSKSKLSRILDHTFEEFFDIGKYFLMGSLLSAIFQTYIPQDILAGVGGNILLSVLAMGGFAFFLSVCSEVDAFIARSLLGPFQAGSILTFMVLGPMIDVKNTLMLSSRFKKSFLVMLIALIIGLNLTFGLVMSLLLA